MCRREWALKTLLSPVRAEPFDKLSIGQSKPVLTEVEAHEIGCVQHVLQTCFGLLGGAEHPRAIFYHPVLPQRHHPIAWIPITRLDVRAPGIPLSAHNHIHISIYQMSRGGVVQRVSISVHL
jgi:hypothetical protein